MSLTLQPKTLLDALSRVDKAIERRTTIPILSHARMSVANGELSLRGTDIDSEIETSIACEGEIAPVCAQADLLQSAVAHLSGRGEISIDLDGQALVLAAGRARFTVPILPPDGFPSLKLGDEGCGFVMEGKLLASLFASCAYAMSSEQTRYYLNGVLLFRGGIGEEQGAKLCGVATNGHMLAAREVDVDLPKDFEQIIVPRKAVLSLGKMVESWSEVAVEVTPSRFTVRFGSTRLTTKLVEGTYPDWRRVVPAVAPQLSYESEKLSSAVATAFAAVQHEKTSAAVSLNFDEGETVCTAHGSDSLAGGMDVCPHTQMGEPGAGRIGVSAKYLLDTLAALKAETAQIGFADSGSPIVFTAEGLTDRKVVVMPMRV